MTAKIKSINEECNITLTYNLENAFRYSRFDQAKKWQRDVGTPALIKRMCQHRNDSHHYCDPDSGYAYVCCRNKLQDWRMRREELHYFYGLFQAGGADAVDEFFGIKPVEPKTNDQ